MEEEQITLEKQEELHEQLKDALPEATPTVEDSDQPEEESATQLPAEESEETPPAAEGGDQPEEELAAPPISQESEEGEGREEPPSDGRAWAGASRGSGWQANH